VPWPTLDLTELLSIDEEAEQASSEETVDKVFILSDTEAVCTVLGTHTTKDILNIYPAVIGC